MRVAVSGAAGRMGSLVAETVAARSDLELHGCFDPVGSGSAGGLDVVADPEVVKGADVVVEFTRPDVVLDNLERWRRFSVHAVVGTSGFGEDRLETVRRSWGSGPPNCIVVPNFSIGAVLMMRFAEQAAPHFAASEVIELHHDRKADAPSGTATASAERIGRAGGASGPGHGVDGGGPGRPGGQGRGRPGPLGPSSRSPRTSGGRLREPRGAAHDPPRLDGPRLVHARGPARGACGRRPAGGDGGVGRAARLSGQIRSRKTEAARP